LLIPAAATTPLGLGATELGGTSLLGSSSPRGGIAGGQVGFNWQAGMVVFGAEFDAQWSGQSNAVSLICTPPIPGCTATRYQAIGRQDSSIFTSGPTVSLQVY
jgi:outer membrane immunogenic protein